MAGWGEAEGKGNSGLSQVAGAVAVAVAVAVRIPIDSRHSWNRTDINITTYPLHHVNSCYDET